MANERDNMVGLRKALLDSLTEIYGRPVFCFLRHKGHNEHSAKTLTDDFLYRFAEDFSVAQQKDFAELSLRRRLIIYLEQANASTHQRQLSHHMRSAQRTAERRRIDAVQLPKQIYGVTAQEAFNYAWLTVMLDHALLAARDECQATGLSVHWQMFFDQVLQPIYETKDPPPLRKSCQDHGVSVGLATEMLTKATTFLREAFTSCMGQCAEFGSDFAEFFSQHNQSR